MIRPRILGMEGKMNHQNIWNAIEMFARDHDLTCSGLARKGGLDATTFNPSKRYSKEGQPRWPSTQSIAKFLAATGKTFSDFTRYLAEKTA